MAGFMHKCGICEERGSGYDKIIGATCAASIVAPRIEDQEGAFTKVVLFSKMPFDTMTKDDRMRTCYMRARLASVNYEAISNQDIRQLFDIPSDDKYKASRIIKDTLTAGLVKPIDPKETMNNSTSRVGTPLSASVFPARADALRRVPTENGIVHRFPKQKVFFDGQVYDAFELLVSLARKAGKSITLIDGYVDAGTLSILAKKDEGVDVTIWTRPSTRLIQADVDTFNAQYPQLTVGHTTAFHDRFLILDGAKGYFVGASIKDAGKKSFAITRIEDANVVSDILARLEAAV